MIKLKSLLSEEKEEKYWWMDPDGKLYKVGYTNHAPFAAHYLLTLRGLSPEELKSLLSNDVFTEMYKREWVRVALIVYYGDYSVLSFNSGNKEPSVRQLGALKDLADELQVSEMRNNSTGKRYQFGDWE
jgi:hypothetical protein